MKRNFNVGCHSPNNVLPEPTAHITINKNRVKIYQSKNIFFKNNQNFEIELFNPTQKKLKAQITLNGDVVSGGGVIIKPGERVYLERYVDSNNKFQFQTYEVEKNNDTLNAISQNGTIEVKFFEENVELYNNSFTHYYHSGAVSVPPYFTTTSTTGNWSTMGNSFYNKPEENQVSFQANDSLFETGRVEKGGKSNQEFETTYGNYHNFPVKTIDYKILPLSEKLITSEDKPVKRYCQYCGGKAQIKWSYCSHCGEKL